jgi:hypothetical protein
MHIQTNDKDLAALLVLYNQEIDTLKAKLLNGTPWEDLTHTRKNITELAIAIHKSHKYKLPEHSMASGAAAFSEKPMTDNC